MNEYNPYAPGSVSSDVHIRTVSIAHRFLMWGAAAGILSGLSAIRLSTLVAVPPLAFAVAITIVAGRSFPFVSRRARLWMVLWITLEQYIAVAIIAALSRFIDSAPVGLAIGGGVFACGLSAIVAAHVSCIRSCVIFCCTLFGAIFGAVLVYVGDGTINHFDLYTRGLLFPVQALSLFLWQTCHAWVLGSALSVWSDVGPTELNRVAVHQGADH